MILCHVWNWEIREISFLLFLFLVYLLDFKKCHGWIISLLHLLACNVEQRGNIQR